MSVPDIQTFARIRKALCWERAKRTIHVHKRSIGIAPDYNATITRPIVNFIEFDRVFQEQSINQDVFDGVLKKLCDSALSALSAIDSIFICYGQTASGKTHTVLGSDRPTKVDGVLQVSAEYLLKQNNVLSVELQVIESYGSSNKGVALFDVLGGQQVQSDILSEGTSSFTSSKITDRGMNRILGKIRSNLHFGCTSRHNQSSRGHVAYILSITRGFDGLETRIMILDLGASSRTIPFTKPFSASCDPLILKNWQHEGDVMECGLQRLEKQIRKYASGGTLKGNVSDLLRALLYMCLVNDTAPNMSILFTFSPSITCIEESRVTLRMVHSMTGCRVKPERCCWKSEHSDDPKMRFKNAIHSVQLKIKVLKQMRAARGQTRLRRDSEDLQMIFDAVTQTMDARKPMKLMVDSAAAAGWSRDDELQQERLMNISGLKEDADRSSLRTYYEELEFASNAAMAIMGVDDKESDDRILSDERRVSVHRTQQIVHAEMESLRSAARNSQISLPIVIKELLVDTESHRRLSLLSVELGIGGDVVSAHSPQTSASPISSDSNEITQLMTMEDADDKYLTREHQEMEQYSKTLWETLDILRDVPDYAECFPQEIKRIVDELKKVSGVLRTLEHQTNALRNHTKLIEDTLKSQMRPVSEIDDGTERRHDEVTVDPQEQTSDDDTEEDWYDFDQLLWETLYFVVVSSPCFISR